jgi:hypothetical protein
MNMGRILIPRENRRREWASPIYMGERTQARDDTQRTKAMPLDLPTDTEGRAMTDIADPIWSDT